VDVKRIWQTEDGCIRMRWTVHGIPRVPWEAEGVFDGISQYKLDREGKIYEHAVDNVILRDPPVGVLPWLWSISLQPQRQQAVPGAFFEPGALDAGAAARVHAHAHGAAVGDDQGRGRAQRRASAVAGEGGDGGCSNNARSPKQQQQQQQAPHHQQQQPGWWSALLVRFSWVRFYAALIATMQLLQQQQERLRLRPAAMQQVCTERS
jgi:hypothetical protein